VAAVTVASVGSGPLRYSVSAPAPAVAGSGQGGRDSV
jgi:hypothetical protein